MIFENLKSMKDPFIGMDIIIVSVSTEQERFFWLSRFEKIKGSIIKQEAQVFVILETWPSGAGNALGTLYAFEKASEEHRKKTSISLLEELENGKNIAIYHTAGKGTRLAPLTASEYNNKSRIKLVSSTNQEEPLTILEATLLQTSIFAKTRKGRLLVFWGDQIFIPDCKIEEPNGEIDLLIQKLPEIPNEQYWKKHHFYKYGLVLINSDQSIKQLEKLSYDDFEKLGISNDQKLGLSLGSFSLSKNILEAFLNEFSKELKEKSTKLDTDPHLWMPLTLDFKTYCDVFEKKQVSKDFYESHYQRMNEFKNKFLKLNEPNILMGSTNMGEDTLWWDYGNSLSFYKNSLKLLNDSIESEAMRSFYNVEKANDQTGDLEIENSILINCHIKSGEIKNSILINVSAAHAIINDSLVINTSAQKIDVNFSIVYNALENGLIELKNKQIRADVFTDRYGHFKLFNSFFKPLLWDQLGSKNPLSFSDLHKLNQKVDSSLGQTLALSSHNQIKQKIDQL